MEKRQNGNGPLVTVVGLFFLWRAYDDLHVMLRYGRLSFAGFVYLAIAGACFYFAYKMITAPQKSFAAPEPTVEPPLSDDDDDDESTSGSVDPTDLTINHPSLRMTLPDGWTRKPAPDPLFAMFEDDRHIPISSLNVVLGTAPPALTADAILEHMMSAHAKSLANNHRRQMDPQPFEITTHDGIREATRVYLCTGEAAPWRVTSRYATTVDPIGLRGQSYGHPVVQITCYESPWSDDSMKELIAGAEIAPMAAQRLDDEASGPRYPYVLHRNSAKQRDEALVHHGRAPEGTAGLVSLGNDLFLTVAEDLPNGVRALFPTDLDGASLEAALDEAGRRVSAELGTDEIPMHTYEVNVPIVSPIWQPGMHAFLQDLPKMKMVVIGPSWKAASALGSPELYARAAAAIGTDALCAVVPHRDRIFVFPDRGAENELIAQRIVSAESESALKPLSPRPFRLRREGLFPAPNAQTN